MKAWEVVAVSGYDDVRDVGQAVTLQEKEDDEHDLGDGDMVVKEM